MKELVVKKIIYISDCLSCSFFSEGNSHEEDCCFHEHNPNGENLTMIEDINTIPIWCPLEDASYYKCF